jgi:hypothetical protein
VGLRKMTPESLCSPALLFVRELLNGAAGCVDEFDWGEIQLFEGWFDFGTIADFNDDEMVGVDVRFGDAFDVLWSDSEVGGGKRRVVVEGTLVKEDGSHCVGGRIGGLELAWERLDASDLGLFDLRVGRRFGLDAF